MGIWIGVDGGGSKTSFVAVNERGAKSASYTTGSLDYHQDGVETCCRRLEDGIARLTQASEGEHVLGIGIGMPAYGEGGAEDDAAADRFCAVYPNDQTVIVNDAQTAWAGSLAMSPGVNVVAGTGAIAFGRDATGACARAGGWSELFSDEGSGYWLGRMALGLFAKQSDGRVPKSALYALVREHFGILRDEEICSAARDRVFVSRHNVAALQRILAEAAMHGDDSAAQLYKLAGAELASSVLAVIRALKFTGTVNVSYSGGVFGVGELMLRPFEAALGAGIALHRALLPPDIGAALTAVERIQPGALRELIDRLLSESIEK